MISASVGEQSSELPVVHGPVFAPSAAASRGGGALADAHGVVAGDGHAPVVVLERRHAVDVADGAAALREAAARARVDEEVRRVALRGEERRQRREVRAHEALAVARARVVDDDGRALVRALVHDDGRRAAGAALLQAERGDERGALLLHGHEEADLVELFHGGHALRCCGESFIIGLLDSSPRPLGSVWACSRAVASA